MSDNAAMQDENAFLIDAFRRQLSETVTPARIRGIERGEGADALWNELYDTGFLDALVPEASGGAGLTLAQAFPLLMAAGEHAVPLPFAETMVARGLLVRHGAPAPQRAVIVLGGDTQQVPGGRFATHALVERDGGGMLLRVTGDDLDVFGTGGCSSLDEGEVVARVPLPAGACQLAAAAVAAALMAGAMGRVLDMALRYAGARQQFGRALGKFQAIQQQLAVLAQEVITAQVAARSAFVGQDFDPARVAAAKCRANEAAGAACNIAHAIHGAIGATQEFDLQLYTRRLKEWQIAFGSETYWAARLGRLRLAAQTATSADFLRQHLAHEE
ncbi:acyl-CoA dehydrogenase [Novosphingobium rosa]|uniref:acyl-CoA dehydrogenase n=1 Tax=Novosphingobium rosa TaxID=76978 RepID=UPI000A03E927|nr:acyl-CoA dehydrogenase [Novosphingobium rosa]